MVTSESRKEANQFNALKKCNIHKENFNNNGFKIYHQNINGLLLVSKTSEIYAHLHTDRKYSVLQNII
jgi:hypothetical protein